MAFNVAAILFHRSFSFADHQPNPEGPHRLGGGGFGLPAGECAISISFECLFFLLMIWNWIFRETPSPSDYKRRSSECLNLNLSLKRLSVIWIHTHILTFQRTLRRGSRRRGPTPRPIVSEKF